MLLKGVGHLQFTTVQTGGKTSRSLAHLILRSPGCNGDTRCNCGQVESAGGVACHGLGGPAHHW